MNTVANLNPDQTGNSNKSTSQKGITKVMFLVFIVTHCLYAATLLLMRDITGLTKHWMQTVANWIFLGEYLITILYYSNRAEEVMFNTYRFDEQLDHFLLD